MNNQVMKVCEYFSIHSEICKNVVDCVKCHEFEKHKKKNELSRDAYVSDKNVIENSKHVVADLQKIIMLPRLEQFKQVIFTKRIVAYNQSFVTVGNKNKMIAWPVIWHEGIAGRKKEELTSAYHMFLLQHRDAELITFWTDNCTAQNKNWTLF